jgi:hypothetical protein
MKTYESTFMISRRILLRIINFSDKQGRENNNTHLSSSDSCAVYEIMLKNTAHSDRPKIIVKYVHALCVWDY